MYSNQLKRNGWFEIVEFNDITALIKCKIYALVFREDSYYSAVYVVIVLFLYFLCK